jgi:hypothetical protein
MSAKGKVSAEEMNQLAERGIPAWQLLADKIGKSVPEAMKLAEKGAISAADAIPAILAGMNAKFGGSMEALSKTLTGQWSNFKDLITQALIPIGQAVTPALAGLLKALMPVVELLGTLAKWFSNLPAPVKTFAVVLAGLLAAIGPLLLIVGQFAVGIAAIGPALAGLGITLSISVGALLGWAVAIAAGVAALVAVGVWVHNNWDAIMAVMFAGLAKVVGAFKLLTEAAAFLTQKIPGLGAAWAAVDAGLGKLQKSLDDTAQKHRDLAKEAEKSWDSMAKSANKSFDIIDAVLAKLAKDQQDLAKAQEASDKLAKELGVSTTAELKKTLEDRRRDLAQWIDDEKKGIRTHQDVAAATLAVAEAAKALAAGSPNVVAAHKAAADAAAKAAKAEEELVKQEIVRERMLLGLSSSIYKFLQGMDEYNKKLEENKKRLEEAAQAQLEHLNTLQAENALKKFNADVEKATADIHEWAKAHGLLTPMINKTYDALKALGLVAADVYQTAAEKAKAAYDTIAADSTQSLYTQTQARLVWLEAEKQAALAAGEIWSAAQQKELDDLNAMLDNMEQKTKKHTQKTKTIWEEWSKSVASTAKQFIGGVIERIFSGSDVNKQLDQQAKDLQASLAGRTTEYQKSVGDIKTEQDKETQNYKDALAAEDSDYESSLADRTKQYQDFADSIPGLLADAEKKAADDLQKTTDDLKGQLADRKLDYDRYVSDVGNRIEDIRQKHADELSGELEDLQDSLDDRLLAYQRFVEDAASSLSELREKHADNIADETKDVGDNIRDRTKDYTRYAEDTAKKIQKVREKNNGVYSDEEDDLVVSLNRRQQDLQSYINDQQRDLDEYKARQLRDQQEEEQKLQESLARKAQDQQAYQDEIEQKRQAAITGNQKQQDEEIAAQQLALARKTEDYQAYVTDIAAKQQAAKDLYATTVDAEQLALNQSLADRKADLETFSADLLTQHNTNRDYINATYVANTAKLKEELGNQETEYQTFVTDVNSKLETLKNEHRTIWEDIGGFGVAAFEKIGIALAELLGEKALGALAKTLGNLITEVFPSLGTALGKALGTVPSAGASVPGVPSGGGGAPGGGMPNIGGAIPIVGMVSGVVSAVSGIVGNFQNAQMEKTMNAVEESTRYMKIGLVTQPDSLLNDSHIIRNTLTDFNQWVHSVLQTYLFTMNVDLDAISGTLQICSATREPRRRPRNRSWIL